MQLFWVSFGINIKKIWTLRNRCLQSLHQIGYLVTYFCGLLFQYPAWPGFFRFLPLLGRGRKSVDRKIKIIWRIMASAHACSTEKQTRLGRSFFFRLARGENSKKTFVIKAGFYVSDHHFE